jgi:hypothetical protein
MDSVGIRGPTRKMKEFFTFSVSSALRHSPSARCVIAANDMQIFGHFWQKKLSPLRTLSRYEEMFRSIICI